ncbi:hypothetical protein [Sphingomonas sp. GB1N7]|uniref:hypothetical protein n=1 Tax=Parasphingomonas caseinilytica TaxID=3096158 RepID=UPI002FC8DBBC
MKISDAQALAEILNRQQETIEPDLLDALGPRLEAYAGGAPWRPEDAVLVWTSPDARRAFVMARRAVLATLETSWAGRGFGRAFLRRAADDGASDELVMGEAGVTIRILRAPGSGDWLINIELSPDALALIPAGTALKLSDSGGTVWLIGEPDRSGGVDAFWERAESPIERLRTHQLTLGFL